MNSHLETFMSKSDPHEICKWQLEDEKKGSAAYREEAQRAERVLENIRTLFYIAKNGPVLGEYEGFGLKEADELLETIADLLGEEHLPKLDKEWRPPDDYTLDRDTW
jgi:hypothetical protein